MQTGTGLTIRTVISTSCGELDWNIYDESLGAQYDTSDVRQRGDKDVPITVAIIGAQVDNGSASELECQDTSATTNEDITLVSNLDTFTYSSGLQDRVGNIPDNTANEAGTQIITGDHAAGYAVNAVQLSIHSPFGLADKSPKLKIHSDNNGALGTLLHTITTSAGIEEDLKLEFTISPAITLLPNTKYWLMFADDTTTTGANYLVNGNDNRYYDGPCGEAGFSIGTGRYTRIGGTLARQTRGPLSIAVIGARVGEATTVSCQTPDKVTVDTYTKIGMEKTAIGAFQSDKDADWFAVTLEEDVDYQFDMFTGINGGGDTAGGVMDIAVYNDDGNGDGEVQVINLMEVDPSIARSSNNADSGTVTVWWEKRRAYFKPADAGKYYLRATLKGSAYQNPTYTVRVRKADDYVGTTMPGEVTVGGSVNGHFFTEHGEGADTDWISVSLTSGQTYNLTLTGHATANTQMKILGVYESDGTTKVHDGASAGKYSSTVSVQFTPDATESHYVVLSSKQHVRMCQENEEGSVETVCAVQAKHPAPDYTFSVVAD